ncbi:unnamed protein product, partial [Gadus morhua 'NCC']
EKVGCRERRMEDTTQTFLSGSKAKKKQQGQPLRQQQLVGKLARTEREHQCTSSGLQDNPLLMLPDPSLASDRQEEHRHLGYCPIPEARVRVFGLTPEIDALKSPGPDPGHQMGRPLHPRDLFGPKHGTMPSPMASGRPPPSLWNYRAFCSLSFAVTQRGGQTGNFASLCKKVGIQAKVNSAIGVHSANY